jgi:hypothetical protein
VQLTSIVRASCTAVIVAGVLIACDNVPNQPSNPPSNPGGNQPPPQVTPTVVRLELSGPESVAPGATAQFTLTAFYSDGSSQDRSSQGTWRTTNSNVLSISPGGVASGRARGEVVVTVSFSGRSATKTGVLVLPEGTFRLRGAVRDAGFGVPAARVEITEGPFSGMWTSTNSEGSYVFYGVAGDVELSVMRNGYQVTEQRFQVTGHQTFNVDLVLSGSREIVQGRYTLRATASGECQSRLPADLRTRTYTADVVQNGPTLAVTLGGATFYRPSQSTAPLNKFNGRVEPGVVEFELYGGGYYYFYGYAPEIAEQITATSLFSISGSARLTRTSTGYAGPLNGSFATMRTTFFALDTCYAQQHGFELIGPEK